MVNLTRAELHRYARAGAQARIHELQEELSRLQRLFPANGNGATTTAESAPTGARRRRRRMSAAARKAVSVRMRAYWKARRAEKVKAAAKR